MNIKFPTFALCALLLSCGMKPEVKMGRRKESAPPPTSALKMNFQNQTADAYAYTFGTVPLTISPREASGGDASFEIKVTRTAKYKRNPGSAALTAVDESALQELCADLTLASSASGASLAAKRYTPADTLFLTWRSHYPFAVQRTLAALLAEKKIEARCVLALSVTSSGGTEELHAVLDPTPLAAGKYAGTSSLQEAADAGVMLLQLDETDQRITLGAQWQSLEVASAAAILPGIKALNPNDLKTTVTGVSAETKCYYTSSDQTNLLNPEETQQFTYAFQGATPFRATDVMAAATGGRMLPECANIKPAVASNEVKLAASCLQFKDVEFADKNGACAWDVGLANTQDAKNTVLRRIDLAKPEIEVMQVKTPQDAAKVLPKSEKNPIRKKTLAMDGFNEGQLASFEQMFDLWIAASPASFATMFENKIETIYYRGNQGNCSSTVLAYATVGTPEIFWCQNAGMSPGKVTPEQSPLSMMLMSVTALHEGLHGLDFTHDINEPNYAPCKGTSNSAVISYDVVVTCKKDYCYPLKSMAIHEYLSELDYSLRGDDRRFAGQCQTWNQGLGLTTGDFGT